MTIGTKSLIFGVHNPFIHYYYTAKAWLKLYGFNLRFLDPRLHLSFLLHDLGYWGCKTMDGEDGSRHPELGARVIGKLFGIRWYDFCLFHSGTMVKIYNEESDSGFRESKLFAADKLSSILYPKWLYKILSTLSGEWFEYAEQHFQGKFKGIKPFSYSSIYLEIETPDVIGPESQVLKTYKKIVEITFEQWHEEAMEHMKKRAYDYMERLNV